MSLLLFSLFNFHKGFGFFINCLRCKREKREEKRREEKREKREKKRKIKKYLNPALPIHNPNCLRMNTKSHRRYPLKPVPPRQQTLRRIHHNLLPPLQITHHNIPTRRPKPQQRCPKPNPCSSCAFNFQKARGGSAGYPRIHGIRGE